MRMRTVITLLAVLGSLGSFWADVPAQEKPRKPKAETVQLAPGLNEITVSSVNLLACTGPDGLFLVDAGWERIGESIQAELKKIGAGEAKYLVDTHWHFDHVEGNKALGKGALIVAHRSVLDLLSSDQTLLGDTVKASPEAARPKVVFERGVEFLLNGEDIQLAAFPPGHTGGDVVVLFKRANVAHIGDILFADQFPFVDLDHGGSVAGLPESLQKVIEFLPAGARVVPGHGRVLTVEDLKAYREMVLATTEVVRREKAKGLTLEAIQKADVLKDWAKWDGSFKRSDWIEMIYKGLP